MKKEKKIKKTIAITIAGTLMTSTVVPAFAETDLFVEEMAAYEKEAQDINEVKSIDSADSYEAKCSEKDIKTIDNRKSEHLTVEQVTSAVEKMAENYRKTTSANAIECFYEYENDDSFSPRERTVSVNSLEHEGYEYLMSSKLVLEDKEGNEIDDVTWYAYSLESSKFMLPEETKSSPESYIILNDDGSFTAKPLALGEKSQGLATLVFGEYNGSLYCFMGKLKTTSDSKDELADLIAAKIVSEHPEWKKLPKHKAALEVHNYVIDKLYYPDKDKDLVTFNLAEKSDGYVYDALVKGYAVCNGYAKTYKALLDKLNIDAVFVKGNSVTTDTVRNTAHAWNLIKLEDDKWYVVDTTWDDVNGGRTTYFLMDINEFNRTHTKSPLYDDVEFGTEFLNKGNTYNPAIPDKVPEIPYNRDTYSQSSDEKLSCAVKFTEITESSVTVSFTTTQHEDYDSCGIYIYRYSETQPMKILPQNTKSYTFQKDGVYKIVFASNFFESQAVSEINVKLGAQPSEQNPDDLKGESSENTVPEELDKNDGNESEGLENDNQDVTNPEDTDIEGGTDSEDIDNEDDNDLEEDSSKDDASEETEKDNESEEIEKDDQGSTDSGQDSSENSNAGNNADGTLDDNKKPETDSNNDIIEDVKPEEQLPNIPYNEGLKSYSDDGKLSNEIKVKNVTKSKVEVSFNPTKNAAYNRYAFFIYKGVGSAKKPIATLNGNTKYYTFKSDGLYTIEYTDMTYASPVISEMNIKIGYNCSSGSGGSGGGSGSGGSSSSEDKKSEDKINEDNNNVLNNTEAQNQTAIENKNEGQAIAENAGWNMVDGKWHFISDNGEEVKGWVKSPESGTWYHMDADGTMATNKWIQDSGKWYYLGETGAMKTGWIQENGKWYYLNTESGTNSGIGSMQTGWIKSPESGKWYYCDESGAMLSNTTVNGYVLGPDGAWVK